MILLNHNPPLLIRFKIDNLLLVMRQLPFHIILNVRW